MLSTIHHYWVGIMIGFSHNYCVIATKNMEKIYSLLNDLHLVIFPWTRLVPFCNHASVSLGEVHKMFPFHSFILGLTFRPVYWKPLKSLGRTDQKAPGPKYRIVSSHTLTYFFPLVCRWWLLKFDEILSTMKTLLNSSPRKKLFFALLRPTVTCMDPNQKKVFLDSDFFSICLKLFFVIFFLLFLLKNPRNWPKIHYKTLGIKENFEFLLKYKIEKRERKRIDWLTMTFLRANK